MSGSAVGQAGSSGEGRSKSPEVPSYETVDSISCPLSADSRGYGVTSKERDKLAFIESSVAYTFSKTGSGSAVGPCASIGTSACIGCAGEVTNFAGAKLPAPTSEDDEEVRGHFLLSSNSFSAGRCLGDAGRAMSADPASAAEDESVCTLSNDGA